MSFVDLQNFSTPPNRVCGAPFGNVLDAFPPKPIGAHDRLGYSFRVEPCNAVSGYSPDICVGPDGALKMPPADFGGEADAQLRVIQAAFKCSSVGATDSELRELATSAIERNFWREVDDTLISILADEAVAQPGGSLSAACVLAEAAQFLATNSHCGTGVIYGSTSWVVRLTNNLIRTDDGVYKDLVGNVIIPSSVDLDVVYAFDSEVEVRESSIELLDEYAPGIRTVNDRVVRAEKIFTVALDNCAVGSFGLTACA